MANSPTNFAHGRLNAGSRAFSYMIGASVIVFAGATAATSLGIREIVSWAENVFGIAFLAVLCGLVLIAFYAWVRMLEADKPAELWLSAGVQAANGIATLALTYTLLGISLGVGGLATQELTPETVQEVVRGLTAKFSLAFLTTVIGLPLSAIVRTLLLVTHARQQDRAAIRGQAT